MADTQQVDTAVARMVDRAAAGAGHAIVVVGERGAGRTRCAREAAGRARDAGMRVLDVHTGGVAVGVPFEVATELLSELSGLPEDDDLFAGAAAGAWHVLTGRLVPRAPDERDRTVHALHWLVRRLAEHGPLALVVDDLDVADEETVRWLEYVATRSSGLPLLLLVTVASQAQGRSAEIRASLSALAGAAVHRLQPLGPEDARAALAGRGLPDADAAFARACVDLTGGNAGLLVELVDEVAARGMQPDAGSIGALEALEPPTTTIRTVGARLRRLGPQAAAVADAVFVLGEDATLARAARVAGVTGDEVRVLADGLAAAALLAAGEPPRVRCPMVERVLAVAPASLSRSEMRRRAVELLRDESVPLQRVAAHVHGTEPGTASAGIEVLVAAAQEELGHGRLEGAEHHLQRAVLESASDGLRREVRLLLVCAQVALGRPGAEERFEAVLADRPPSDEVLALERLGEMLLAAGRRRAAAEAFQRAAEAADGAWGAHLRARVQGRFAAVARDLPGLATTARDVLRRHDGEPLHASLAILAAVDAAYAGRPRAGVRALAEAALDAILRDGASAEEAVRCVAVLLWCEELGHARRALHLLRSNRIAGEAELAPYEAWLALAEGRPADAARTAGRRLRPTDDIPGRSGTTVAAAVAAFARLELDDADGAAAALDAVAARDREERGLDVHVLDARGWLALRDTGADVAYETFAHALDLARSAAMDNPAVVRSWLGAAWALQRLGRVAEGRQVAEQALARAQAFGAPRTEALALHTAAALATGRVEAEAMLARALELVQAPEAGLDRARILLAQGGMLCRDGRRAHGRDVLRAALDLAHRLGAVDLEGRARAALRVAGARPRRAHLHGVDSLTPAERQVAEHAARGLSNKDIAEVLFVTAKTVEWHLRNVYLKLGIAHRRDLAAALRERPDRPAAADGRQ